MRKIATALVAVAGLASASIAAAEPIRAADSHVAGQRLGGNVRASARTGKENGLLGAPLFLVFLGAVTVTVAAIVISNNSNSN